MLPTSPTLHPSCSIWDGRYNCGVNEKGQLFLKHMMIKVKINGMEAVTKK